MTPKIRVLMVDDEERFRETTAKLLTHRGFETTIAASGEEAIQILKKQPHDVVVLDIRMPGMDGHQALSAITSNSPIPKSSCSPGTEQPIPPVQPWPSRPMITSANRVISTCWPPKSMTPTWSWQKEKPAKQEKKARDIMIHIDDYSTVYMDNTVKEAIDNLRFLLTGFVSSSRLMETGHRSLLVFDLT